jgi:monofunctional biosynthetic peptidoglycan transglycosylase
MIHFEGVHAGRQMEKTTQAPRIVIGVWLLAGMTMAGLWWYMTLPDGSEFVHTNPRRTAMIRYREGEGDRTGPITWVPLSRISPTLRRAVIIAEDANFYHHKGIDWEAAWSALQRDWRERRFSRGGSTITQQLAKNLYLQPRKTIWRKVTEALIAMRIERHLSKPRLLELYLNVVEWGHGIYGAEAAARHYFGKSAAELTIEEASWLAAILPAPLRYEQHPRARFVVARASTIQHYLEQQLAGRVPPATTPELPPVPPPEEENDDEETDEPSLEPPPSVPPQPPPSSAPSSDFPVPAATPQPPPAHEAPPPQYSPLY